MNTAAKLPLTIDENVDAQISELDDLFALHKFNKAVGRLQETFAKRVKSGGPAAGHAFAQKMARLSEM